MLRMTRTFAPLRAASIAILANRYAGEWPREAFRRHGVAYEPAEKVKSDIYLAFLPLLNSGRVDFERGSTPG